MMSLVWPFLIYWLVIFVACFVVVEIAQDQLYDEVTPRRRLEGRRRFGLDRDGSDGAAVLRRSGIF